MDRSRPVSEREIATFQHDGAICLRQKFDQKWLDLIAEGIEQNLAAPSEYAESLSSEGTSARFFSDYCNWRRIPEFQTFVYDSPAAEIVARLMGSNKAIFYHDHLLIKEPGTQRETPWHHDQPYYPVNGQQMCSLWLPLDPVPLHTSLRFVKGSHTWGRWFVPRKFATSRNYAVQGGGASQEEEMMAFESAPDIEAHPDKYEVVSWELEPGDCVVFHGMTLHGAAGNRSQTTARRALSTRWFGDDARFAERPWEISPPITGGLKPGEPMACDTFPVIWEKGR